MIGWQSTAQYSSHYASDGHDSNEAVCRYQTRYFTTLVYRVDSGKSLVYRVDSGKSSFVYIYISRFY